MLFLTPAANKSVNSEGNQAINISRNTLFLLLLLLLWQVATADISAQYKDEREKFIAAEKAYKRGKISEYQTLRKALKNYPLYPYLEYEELRYGFSNKKLPLVKKFIETYKNVPLSYLLRSAWLNHLAKKKAWESYLELYTPQDSIERQCNYLRALINTKRADEAYKLIKPIWLYGGSRPDDCTPAFKAWHQAGKLTPELAWERIILTMEKDEVSRARYLSRYLPKNQKAWFTQWTSIHNSPNKLARKIKLRGPEKLQKTITAHGLKRLARSDINAAYALWQKLQKEEDFPEELMQQAEHAIAMRMMLKKHKQSLEFLDQIQPHATDIKLHEKRLRYVLSKQRWDLVYKWTKQLPKRLRTSDKWRYWNAKAAGELGKRDEFKGNLQQVAKERSFYGFLAADILNVDYNLNYIPSKVSTETMRQLKNNQGLIRSREMFLLERFTSSRREWRTATKGMKHEQLKGAAILARDWGLHDRSIVVLAQGALWDDLGLRFPVAHRKQVDKMAQEKSIESAWVFAVIRQESTFMQDAQSPAGALGLMQLMPATARSTARKIKMGSPKKSKILQPEINIRLGASYLKIVLNELGQNRVLATAAYNAGPGRVRRWLPSKAIPADLWVATVPFDETRGYLERVLAYTIIYKKRLGEKTGRLSDSMPPIQRNLKKPSKGKVNPALQNLMSAQ